MQNVINKTKNNYLITVGIKVSCKHKKFPYFEYTTNSPMTKAYCTQYSTIL